MEPYREGGEKGKQVERMFDSIAPAYDFMNTAMTLGLHRRWRDTALDAAAEALAENRITPERVLDVATGTGDVAFELHRRWPKASITGADLSEGMLDVARRKADALPLHDKAMLTFETGDCLALRFKDDTFDLITVAYGVRNFEHLLQRYREMTLIPLAGRMVSRDPRAYTYLPESIAAAPQRRDMALLMQQAGLRRCRWRSLTFGAVTFYLAQKK